MNKQAITMFQNTIKTKDERIWIKPVCEFFNIDYKWQVEVVRNDHILASVVEKNSSYSRKTPKDTRKSGAEVLKTPRFWQLLVQYCTGCWGYLEKMPLFS